MCFQESVFFSFRTQIGVSEDGPPRYFDNYFPDFCNSIHDNFHQVMDPLAPTLLETCTMALVGVVFLCFVTPKKGWVLSEERPCIVSMAVDFDCKHLFFFVSLFLVLRMFLFLRKSTFSRVIHDRFPVRRTRSHGTLVNRPRLSGGDQTSPKSRRSWTLGSEATTVELS